MIYISIVIISVLIAVIIVLILEHKKDKANFDKKKELLENIIFELTVKLENQSQKLELSEQLKNKIQQGNLSLSDSIFDLNKNLFNELFSEKSI